MIRKILLILLYSILLLETASAQTNTAYEVQRAKINALLGERSAKFGQYDKSLNTRTGIFGLQTKKDIRNSNEILRQIVLNDNEIFTQLKVLMDYKDLQTEEIKISANSNNSSILSYRNTIKQLQDQSVKLTKEVENAEASSSRAYLFTGLSLIGCIALTYLLYNNRIKLKAYKTKNV